MKKIGIYLLVIFLFNCTTSKTFTLIQVEDKWGPPAKIEYRNDKIVYYYYFYKRKVKGGIVGSGPIAMGSGELETGWIILEVIAGQDGKVLKMRKYWKQPELK